MALLYPTLLAAVSNVAAPHWRATSLGVYRLWRDSGYAFSALAIGIVADAFGLLASFWFAATLMIVSGCLVAILMYETLPFRRTVHATWERASPFDAVDLVMSQELEDPDDAGQGARGHTRT